MFMYSHPDSLDFKAKQSLPFLASLSLQFALLAALCCIPVSQMYGPSLRSNVARSSSITPIYFHKDAVTVAPAPEPAPLTAQPAPELPSASTPKTAPEANAEAETTADSTAGDSSGDGEGQGLAPFPSWRMNATPTGFAGMHHQIKNAMPVFTPEPPILHGKVPESARGKDLVMEVLIDDQGSIVTAQVLQGVGYEIESSVVQTLRRWIYIPAKINGVAVASRQKVHFHFPS